MNPPDDTSWESLIRARSGRLTGPDPAWREEILAACETAVAEGGASAPPSAPVTARALRGLLTPRRVAGWSALAACWIASLALNLEARHLNARTAPKTPPPAEFPFPRGSPLLPSEDGSLLLVHWEPTLRPPPAAKPRETPKSQPSQSFHAPPSPRPGPFA